MSLSPTAQTTGGRQRSSWWGPLIVSLGACILTISIVGSAIYLGWRVYDRRQLSQRVRGIVDSLQNRTPEELAERAATLRSHPRVARFVLPEVARSIAESKSEEQLAAAIQVASAFLDDSRIVDLLFRLRLDPRENVAAAAVGALSRIEPPSRAAEMLGKCLSDAATPAAIDTACDGLYRLGNDGLATMRSHLPGLSVERRLWLVRFVRETDRPHQTAWLEMLAANDDERVSDAARQALTASVAPESLSAMGAGGAPPGREPGNASLPE